MNAVLKPLDVAERRARIVAEAKTWIGTPYVSCGDVKGAGVDCAMLLIRVYQTDGTVDPDYDPRPYSMQWFLHRGNALYLNGIIKHCHQIMEGELQPADIAMYNFGRHAAHGAIVVDGEYIIHAYRPGGVVQMVERRSIAHALHSCWSPY